MKLKLNRKYYLPSHMQTHWLRKNKSSKWPRIVCFWDTEAKRIKTTYGEKQVFTLGVYEIWDFKNAELLYRGISDDAYNFLQGLTNAVSYHLKKKRVRRAILVSHNISYDLSLSQALKILPELGWQEKEFAIDNRAKWMRFTNEKKQSLVFIDSFSWLPVPLQIIGNYLGIEKPPLPKGRKKLIERCWADVNILTHGMFRIWKFAESEDWGNFAFTAAGQVWNLWRHKYMGDKSVLVHNNAKIRDVERFAYHAGRSEAFRLGKVENVIEIDIDKAYLTVCEEDPMPVVFIGSVKGRVRKNENTRCMYRIKADVPELNLPPTPCRVDDRVIWPVGKFETIIWDNELELAEQLGVNCEIKETYVYKAERTWEGVCKYLREKLEETDDQLLTVFLKHCSRALAGKSAVHFARWREGESRRPGSRRLLVGDTWWETSPTDQYEGENSIPAMLSAVAAGTRVRLYKGLQLLEPWLVACDTDGVIIKDTPKSRQTANTLFGWKVKKEWKELFIINDRSWVGDVQVKTPGVPKAKHWELGDGQVVLFGEAWKNLGAAITDHVEIHKGSWTLKVESTRREVEGKKTKPIVLDHSS
jgi:hypothetical protein